jgi:hypothetical protein
MAVIKAKKVEFELLKQDVNGAAAKYMMTLSYEPEGLESKEILNIVLCDETPYINVGVENERFTRIHQRTGPDVDPHPDDHYLLSPEELFFNIEQDEKKNDYQKN